MCMDHQHVWSELKGKQDSLAILICIKIALIVLTAVGLPNDSSILQPQANRETNIKCIPFRFRISNSITTIMYLMLRDISTGQCIDVGLLRVKVCVLLRTYPTAQRHILNLDLDSLKWIRNVTHQWPWREQNKEPVQPDACIRWRYSLWGHHGRGFGGKEIGLTEWVKTSSLMLCFIYLQ